MSRPASRGLTLLELLVGLAVSTIVIAAALALMNAQQRAFRSGGDERQVQEAARVALDEMTSNLRLAGYGVDPALAFDFGGLDLLTQTRSPAGTAPTSAPFKCDVGSEVVCRDRVDGPDEIVFRSRDPAFGHRFTQLATADSLTINGPIGAPLEAGQILQVVCYTTPMTWAYVTVGATVKPDPTKDEVTITLKPGDGNVFPLQNGWVTTGTCFTAVAAKGADAPTIDASAKVFKIDTYRYYVESFAGRPYLMLDQGFAAPTVVAPDVEDLQFVYVFPLATAGNQTAGDIPGTALDNSAVGIDLLPAVVPTYTSTSTSEERKTHHPANIRAVRVSAVVRAPAAATDRVLTTIPAAGNREAMPGPSYRRFLLETTCPTRNLDARAPFYPSWSAGLDGAGNPIDVLNKGGG